MNYVRSVHHTHECVASLWLCGLSLSKGQRSVPREAGMTTRSHLGEANITTLRGVADPNGSVGGVGNYPTIHNGFCVRHWTENGPLDSRFSGPLQIERALARPFNLKETENFKFKEEHQPILPSTRDAVETAIDLSKEAGEHTWEALARRVKGRIIPWGKRVQKRSEPEPGAHAPVFPILPPHEKNESSRD